MPALTLLAILAFSVLAVILVRWQHAEPSYGSAARTGPATLPRLVQRPISETRSAATIAEVDSLARERPAIPLSHAVSLLARVTGPKPADTDPGDWEHEVNSTLNALRAREELPPGLTDALVEMAQHHVDPVLRLYALQHLSFLHERETTDAKARITDLFTTLAPALTPALASLEPRRK